MLLGAGIAPVWCCFVLVGLVDWWWFVLFGVVAWCIGWCYLVCLVLGGTSTKTLIMWCVLFGDVGVGLVLFGAGLVLVGVG